MRMETANFIKNSSRELPTNERPTWIMVEGPAGEVSAYRRDHFDGSIRKGMGVFYRKGRGIFFAAGRPRGCHEIGRVTVIYKEIPFTGHSEPKASPAIAGDERTQLEGLLVDLQCYAGVMDLLLREAADELDIEGEAAKIPAMVRINEHIGDLLERAFKAL